MQADYKALSRLLGIKPNEIPFRFEKGKPVFDGGLYELDDNLDLLNEKIDGTFSSLRDSMKKKSIADHTVKFLEKLEEALRNYFGRKG